LSSFQVANYGIGGVYNHHTDAAGEQVATLQTFCGGNHSLAKIS
jgi:hypothetical protein